MKMKNKVGIITGSSRGIGKATAIECCEQGATIVLNGRNKERLLATEAELLNKGFNVIAIAGDITSVDDCGHIVNETIRRFGRIDFLVNNGSVTMNETIERIQPHIFEDVVRSNSMGAVYPTMAALPHLKTSNGSVLFISSLAGLHGMPSASAYSLGKMALTAFWQSLKIELAHTGIHFGICYLGFTENDKEKRMVASNGELKPVPNRPKFVQKSQKDVAKIIAGAIRKRKSKLVLSPLGKMANIMMRHFPKLTLFIMMQSQKRKQ